MDKEYRQGLKWRNELNIDEAKQRLKRAEKNLENCKFDLHLWKIRLNKLRKERRSM